MLRRFADKVLTLLAELVGVPRFELEAFERLRKLRLDRLAQLREVPSAIADRAFAHVLYRDQPYGHLPFGTESAVRGLTRDEIVARHAHAYRPSQAVVILAGDATHAEFEQMAGEAFGDWKAVGTVGPQPECMHHGESKRASLVVMDRSQAAQSELRIGHVAVARNTPDYFPLLVMNTALGGQFTSRINLNLREGKGYTYGARSAFEFRREPGPFSVQTSVHTDVTADAIREVLEELRAVRDGRPLTDSEIAHAKRTLTRGYPRGFETTDQVVHGLAQLALHDLPDDHFTRFSPSVTAVQSEDIVRVTQMHLDPLHLSTVVVGDLTVIKDGLHDIGLDAPEKIVLP
jgi:predicted Zn-dependent peptidase